MITLSIDVTQIDKSRLKQVTRRNGEKAKFLELILIETPDSEYGDYMVKQGLTKEEREARVEMPILGNGKNVSGKRQGREQPRERRHERETMESVFTEGDDIPF